MAETAASLRPEHETLPRPSVDTPETSPGEPLMPTPHHLRVVGPDRLVELRSERTDGEGPIAHRDDHAGSVMEARRTRDPTPNTRARASHPVGFSGSARQVGCPSVAFDAELRAE